jgi:hypothetical protein
VAPTAPAAIAEAEGIKEEVKRIMDDASVQVDAAASIISQGNRVDIENVYTDATAKVAQKILADIVGANDAGLALAAALLTEITAFVDIPIVTGIPKQTSTPVSQGFKDAINVGLTDLTALGTYIQGSDIQTAIRQPLAATTVELQRKEIAAITTAAAAVVPGYHSPLWKCALLH